MQDARRCRMPGDASRDGAALAPAHCPVGAGAGRAGGPDGVAYLNSLSGSSGWTTLAGSFPARQSIQTVASAFRPAILLFWAHGSGRLGIVITAAQVADGGYRIAGHSIRPGARLANKASARNFTRQ